MKKLILLLIFSMPISLMAQTEDYSGTYLFHVDGKDGTILDYNLQLNTDHTFIYKTYRRLFDIRGNDETFINGKGTWKVENKIIKFNTEPTDLDKNHTLNFTGTTARVIKKSPRDTSDKIVPTALQFYKTEIKTIANLKLILKE
jgi:hypothetical protein